MVDEQLDGLIPLPAEWTPLTTQRLRLRHPDATDLDDYLALHLDARTLRHHPAAETVTRDSVTFAFTDMRAHWAEHGFGVWMVEQREHPGALIGVAGVSRRRVHGRDALNLYYRFAPEAWGNGFASEAAARAVRTAREHLPGLPVTAYTVPGNAGSLRTALAAGLERNTDLDIDQGGHTDVYLTAGW